jgi:hypothetical protein
MWEEGEAEAAGESEGVGEGEARDGSYGLCRQCEQRRPRE